MQEQTRLSGKKLFICYRQKGCNAPFVLDFNLKSFLENIFSIAAGLYANSSWLSRLYERLRATLTAMLNTHKGTIKRLKNISGIVMPTIQSNVWGKRI